MTERLSGRKSPQHFETEWKRKVREFNHYYLSAAIIAFGLFMGGGFAIPEAERILDGKFNKITYKMHSQIPEEIPIESPLQDIWYISGIASSLAMMGYGIHLRRSTRRP